MFRQKTIRMLGVVRILVGSGLLLTVLGFQRSNTTFVRTLNLPEAGIDHWISLPFRNDYAKASDLCALSSDVNRVSRFDTAAGARVDWTCPIGTDFTLTAGEGVWVKATTASSLRVAGAHDTEPSVPT